MQAGQLWTYGKDRERLLLKGEDPLQRFDNAGLTVQVSGISNLSAIRHTLLEPYKTHPSSRI